MVSFRYFLDLLVLEIGIELLTISRSSKSRADVHFARWWWCGVSWISVWEKCGCGATELWKLNFYFPIANAITEDTNILFFTTPLSMSS
jgi:hypothetical protein